MSSKLRISFDMLPVSDRTDKQLLQAMRERALGKSRIAHSVDNRAGRGALYARLAPRDAPRGRNKGDGASSCDAGRVYRLRSSFITKE